jgi:hypothetical protein
MNEFRNVSSPPQPFPEQHALTQTVATPASAQGALELMTIWAGQKRNSLPFYRRNRIYDSADRGSRICLL